MTKSHVLATLGLFVATAVVAERTPDWILQVIREGTVKDGINYSTSNNDCQITPEEFDQEILAVYSNSGLAWKELFTSDYIPTLSLRIEVICGPRSAFFVQALFEEFINNQPWHWQWKYRILDVGDINDIRESVRAVTEAALTDFQSAYAEGE